MLDCFLYEGNMNTKNDGKIENVAADIVKMSRDLLIVNMRFLDVAICRLALKNYSGSFCVDGINMYYDPENVVLQYKESSQKITKTYLHMLFHCIFQHPFVNDDIDHNKWNLACDIAVESSIRDLDISSLVGEQSGKVINVLDELNNKVSVLTAEKIYKYLINGNVSQNEISNWSKLFYLDSHDIWYESNGSDTKGTDVLDEDTDRDVNIFAASNVKTDEVGRSIKDEWSDISERVQVDLESFSKEQGDKSGSLLQNLKSVNRERYDYTEFLKKFASLGEVMKINDDEFDYIFYTYGLTQYKNMPLVEPLEYKEVKRIKEFVIAIDTSGSVWENTVKKFLNKTYNILKSEESFFSKIYLHIIQSDSTIRQDSVIHDQKEFDKYINGFEIEGGGGTDFRPVFEYVDELRNRHELNNLKGLIYFTDGLGIFPLHKPEYSSAFVFIDDAGNNYDVPAWAIKLVLDKEDF